MTIQDSLKNHSERLSAVLLGSIGYFILANRLMEIKMTHLHMVGDCMLHSPAYLLYNLYHQDLVPDYYIVGSENENLYHIFLNMLTMRPNY